MNLITNTPKWNHAISKWGGRELTELRKHSSFDKSTTYFHSMRHTYSTVLEAAGIGSERRSALAGQEMPGINAARYTKLRTNPVELRVTMLAGLAQLAAMLDRLVPDESERFGAQDRGDLSSSHKRTPAESDLGASGI